MKTLRHPSVHPLQVNDFSSMTVENVVRDLRTEPSRGLDHREVLERQRKFGYNLVEKSRSKSVLRIILEQFLSPIVWILVLAGGASFLFGEWPEGIAIAILIGINTLIGFFMEWQAIRSMDALRNLSRSMVSVIRENQTHRLDSRELVPGDLLLLEAGNLVTADARIIQVHHLQIEEAALTGESFPVYKQTDPCPEHTSLAERTNMAFAGTTVVRGRGSAVVVATGRQTVFGGIAHSAQITQKGITPLEKRLSTLTRQLIWVTLVIALLVCVAGVLRGMDWLVMVETGMALAIAAIPEGLPVIATITLARGMLIMARRNVMVKSLEAVQTLGETNIILTDKTGTLTENEMQVTSLVIPEKQRRIIRFHPRKKAENGQINWLLSVGLLANDANYENGKWSGDPLDVALISAAIEQGLDPVTLSRRWPRVNEMPFDPELKWMGTVHRAEAGYLVCMKGAADVLLPKCQYWGTPEEKVPFSNHPIWLGEHDQLANEGHRLIALACGWQSHLPQPHEFLEDLTFLGLAAFQDPARKDIREAIEVCRRAGIRVVMVTGDHPETAGHIAEEVHVVPPGESCIKMTGNDLANESQEGKDMALMMKAQVFARINPSQKLDLVKLFQTNGFVVAMTGDGINDALALKKANVGIAMGIRGTEAAKEAADIILKDDAFISITEAIRNGRIIFENIRQFVIYLLSCNLSELLIIGIALLGGMPLPLLPLQILFLNVVTDVFPALALGMSKGQSNIMQVPPRTQKVPIITRHNWLSITVYALAIALGVIGMEIFSLKVLAAPATQVVNFTFYTLIFAQLWNVFNLPGREVSFWKNPIVTNPFIWSAFGLCVLLVGGALAIHPLRDVLVLSFLTPIGWLYVLGFSILPVVVIQLLKRSMGVNI
ncbi:MAG: cation-transporting P-type ATPase [Saprospiraceae bacterium]|nr:cation-transporting P-type ATPase [Saprospiraceae bacterium]